MSNTLSNIYSLSKSEDDIFNEDTIMNRAYFGDEPPSNVKEFIYQN